MTQDRKTELMKYKAVVAVLRRWLSDGHITIHDYAKLEEKQKQQNDYHIQTFKQCFGLDFSKPFSYEDWIGKKGWAIAGQQNNEQYGIQNRVDKYITGPGKGKGANQVDSNY